MSPRTKQNNLTPSRISPKWDESRFYLIDGEYYPRVTSILSALSKPALVPWAVNMVASKMREVLERIGRGEIETEQLRGVIIDDLVKEAKTLYLKSGDEALNIGSFVHKTIEEIISGRLRREGVDERIVVPINRFYQWYNSLKIEPVASEKMVYTDKPKIAGTVDLVAKVNNRLMLIDWKTSKDIYDEYELQLGAYMFLWEAMEPNQKIDGAYIVRIDKSPSELIEFNFEKDVRLLSREKLLYLSEIFLRLFEVYLWKNKIDERSLKFNN